MGMLVEELKQKAGNPADGKRYFTRVGIWNLEFGIWNLEFVLPCSV